MNNFGCNCRNNCLLLSAAASIILGIITAFLTITAAITVTPAFLWVVFGIAVVYLAVTLLVSTLTGKNFERSCRCATLRGLLISILGTILTSVILLAIEFVATSIIGAIITGALILFFSLTLTLTACLVKCIAGCSEDDM